MISIADYIDEAVGSRKAGKYAEEFPDHPDIEKIEMFLLDHGFQDYTKVGKLTDDSLIWRCKTTGSRGFKMGQCYPGENGTWWIKFGDARKTYFCRDEKHLKENKENFRITYGRGLNDYFYTTFDELKKKAESYFGWQ